MTPVDSEIEYGLRRPTPGEFWRLFTTTGWNDEYQLSPAELAAALEASSFVVTARQGSRLIGIGRIISDGVLHALIVDVIVDPSVRRRGVGTRIMALLIEHCRARRIRDVQLFCARGKRGFYERLGFAAREDEAPGMDLLVSDPDRRASRATTMRLPAD